jgi:alpha-L-fucosidase
MPEDRPDIIKPAAPQASSEQPEWLAERLRWFSTMKFGLFLHWGPYCQWGCIESWPLVEEDTWARPDDLRAWTDRNRDLKRFRRDYWKLNRTFNPTRFDPSIWAEAAWEAGMRYVAFTTKHHDGFCMFDTATTTFRSTHRDCPFHTDPRGNITREVFDAFRARGHAISCYFSKSDWHVPHYWWPGVPAPDRNPNYDTHAHPERWGKFIHYVHSQVEELMTGYGPIDALWLDGGQVRPPNQDIDMARMAAMARSHQPGLIVADRTVGGPYENILTPEQEIPEEPLGQAWESCITMGKGWAYQPNDTYKSARKLLRMLIDIVAKGGNLLLNIGPSPEGVLPAESLARLREIGAWMAVNSQAIHDTEPIAPYAEGGIRYTSTPDFVYAIILADECGAAPSEVRFAGALPPPGCEVRLLGRDAPLEWTVEAGQARVALPVGELPCEHAWVLQWPRG